MKQIFIIMGYGVPKDIMTDGNYAVYLRNIFNHIYDAATRKKVEPIIIFSGGKTDLFKPYKRTEADEMIRFFRSLMGKDIVKKITKNWRLIKEIQAYSSLDNLLYSQKIMREKKFHCPITIFCEFTRAGRTKKIACEILKRRMTVCPIDFDVSDNRYRDPAFLKDKERTEIRIDLWALKNSQNLARHRELHKDRIAFLRQGSTSQEHIDLIKKSWELNKEKIQKLALS